MTQIKIHFLKLIMPQTKCNSSSNPSFLGATHCAPTFREANHPPPKKNKLYSKISQEFIPTLLKRGGTFPKCKGGRVPTIPPDDLGRFPAYSWHPISPFPSPPGEKFTLPNCQRANRSFVGGSYLFALANTFFFLLRWYIYIYTYMYYLYTYIYISQEISNLGCKLPRKWRFIIILVLTVTGRSIPWYIIFRRFCTLDLESCSISSRWEIRSQREKQSSVHKPYPRASERRRVLSTKCVCFAGFSLWGEMLKKQ